jgi:preprotein translocase subunit SecD
MRGPGATQLGELTENHKNEFLAIVLDDRILSHPRIQSRITTNGIITGTFRPEEVTSLVTILKGGSLPTKPLLLSRDKVGSVSGEAAIAAGFKSVIVGLVAVAVVTAGYYLFAGLVANFALAINLLGVLAFVLCFHQTLTIPGIAGILLSVGMAIDANVLIYERVREERKRGKTLVQSLNTGYQRAFSAIFDSNLTTVISGLVLFNFGTGPVKGFAVTLVVGLIANLFTSVFISKFIFDWELAGKQQVTALSI